MIWRDDLELGDDVFGIHFLSSNKLYNVEYSQERYFSFAMMKCQCFPFSFVS